MLSVIICTYERPDGAAAALKSVTDVVGGAPVEIVIVDDGSGPEAAQALDLLVGPRVRIVHQDNVGLTGARIRGAAESSGEWLTFLDDDDRWCDGWATLIARLEEPGAGIVSGAARLERPDGTVLRVEAPQPLGAMFEDLTIQYLAGCFAVRRDVYLAAGGYLPGLSSSHQTELMLKCAVICAERGLTALHTDETVAAIERRAEGDRSLFDPRLLYDGTRWNLCRHGARFALDDGERANWEAVAATNAARLRAPRAMHHAWRSAVARPSDPARWLRLVGVHPWVSRLRWPDASTPRAQTTSHRTPLEHAVKLRGTPSAAQCTDSDLLFLPWRYRENPPASSDADGTPFWSEGAVNDVRYQDPVYRWAARLVADRSTRVVDVGCGSGEKLVTRIAPLVDQWTGIDQPSALVAARRSTPGGHWIEADLEDEWGWAGAVPSSADLVICADVIEHVRDPIVLLRHVVELLAPGGRILLSTPDRARLEDREPLGPPRNPRHVREWSEDEFRLLLEAARLRIVKARHLLPRAYSPTPTELRRGAYRLLHRRAVPDRRSCMAFLLVPVDDGPVPHRG